MSIQRDNRSLCHCGRLSMVFVALDDKYNPSNVFNIFCDIPIRKDTFVNILTYQNQSIMIFTDKE